jgi:hypothetical protein
MEEVVQWAKPIRDAGPSGSHSAYICSSNI